MERARQFKHSSISFQFLPLPTPGKLFDIGFVWRDMLKASRGVEEDEDQEGSVDSEYLYLQDMSQHEVGWGCCLEMASEYRPSNICNSTTLSF